MLLVVTDSLQVPDIIALLNTNNGDFAAACSLDFSKPPLFYDTFALRDSKGHEAATQTWPYFRSYKSRHALLNGGPVPVSSCWNGIGASSQLLHLTATDRCHPVALTLTRLYSRDERRGFPWD